MFVVITGCLRISKESIFTGMNNLKIISILNEQYDEYFGFTEDEVRSLIDMADEDTKGEIETLIEGKTLVKDCAVLFED